MAFNGRARGGPLLYDALPLNVRETGVQSTDFSRLFIAVKEPD